MPAIRLRVLLGCIAGVSAGGLGLLAAGGPAQRASHPGGSAPAIERIDRAPIAFEPNAGRTDPRVSFVARGKGYRLFLTRAEAVMALGGGDVVRTRLIGARRAAGPAGLERLPGVVNSYSGARQAGWRTHIPTFGRVRYGGVYPGVALDYHGGSGRLEYDFRVAPGADPSRIRLGISGARGLRVDRRGDLLIRTSSGTVRQLAPVATQAGRPVDAAFVVRGARVGFRLGAYDRSKPLLIDPVLNFGTYLGGDDNDGIEGAAVDSSGNAWVVGWTTSLNFPTVGSTEVRDQNQEAFVAKYAADGSKLFASYYGGAGDELANDVAVDSAGAAYVVGETSSAAATFPLLHAYQGANGGINDAFVMKISSAGALVYSTFYGGTADDRGNAIAVDSTGAAYVAASTYAGFPTTTGGTYTGVGHDIGLVKFTAYSGSGNLLRTYARLVGGSNDDIPNDIALRASDNSVYITGQTTSTDLPVTVSPNAAYQGTLGGLDDAFFARVSTTGATVSTMTYLGGTDTDIGKGIAVDAGGNAYIAGSTNSDTMFAGAPTHQSQDGFAVKLNGLGTALSQGRYLQGTQNDDAVAVAVDSSANVYIAGNTFSSGFPQANSLGIHTPGAGDSDAYLMKLTSDWQATPIFSTFIGGPGSDGDGLTSLAVRPDGSAMYIAGRTANGGFPTPGGIQPQNAGQSDGWLARLTVKPATITSGPAGPTSDSTPTFGFASDSGSTFSCFQDASVIGSACNSGSFTTTALADGAHSVKVKAFDKGGSPATPVVQSFTVDTGAPSPAALGAPDDGATGQPLRPSFTWQAATDGGTGVAQQEVFVDSDDAANRFDGACADNACSGQPPANLSEGAHTWGVRATDAAGNATSTAPRAFTVGVAPVARFTISPNPALAGSTVTFNGAQSSDEGTGVARYEWDLDGDGSFESDTGAVAQASRKYDLPATVKVALRVTDGVGLTSIASADLKVSNAPLAGKQLGVTVNHGAQYTNSPDVTISAVFPATTNSMLFSNDGGFLAPAQFAPKADTPWKLDSSGPERLPKTVYVRFLSGPFVSETFTDDIILDETPPKVVNASLAQPPAAALAARAAAKRTYKLKVKATDNVSGVSGIQVTAKKKKPGKVLRYKSRLTVKLAARPRWVRVRDRAGNFSRWRALK